MPDELLSFNTETQDPTSGTLSFNAQDATRVSDPIAEQRAKDFHFALQGLSPGTGTLKDQIKQANEAGIRSTAAQWEDQQNANGAASLIQDISRRGIVTDHQMEYVRKITGNKADPSVTIENQFAKNWVNHVVTNNENEVFGRKFTNGDLYGILRDAQTATDIATRTKVTQTLLDDVTDQWRQSSTYNKILDIGGGMIPFLSWWRINHTKLDLQRVSWLPGNNLQEQVQYLRSKPVEEMRSTAKQIIDELAKSNLHMAVQFAQALYGYSSEQAFVDNAMGVADAAGVFPYRTAGKAASALFRAAKGLARGSREADVAEKGIEAAVGPRNPLAITDQRGPAPLQITDQREPAPLQLTYQPRPNFEMVSPEDSYFRLEQQKEQFRARNFPNPDETRYNTDTLPTLGPDRSKLMAELRMSDEGPVYERTWKPRLDTDELRLGDEGPIFERRDNTLRDWSTRDPEIAMGDEGPVFERAVRPTPVDDSDIARLGDEGPIYDRLGFRDFRPDTAAPDDVLRMGDEGPVFERTYERKGLRDVNSRQEDIALGDEGPLYEKSVRPPVKSGGFELVYDEPTKFQFKNKEGLTTVSEMDSRMADAERRVAFRDAVKAVQKETPEAALEQAGDVKGAARVSATKEVNRRIEQRDPTGSQGNPFDRVPAFQDPRALFADSVNFAREQSSRIVQALERNGELARRALGPILVQRLSQSAEDASVREAQQGLREYYKRINDSILEFAWNRADDSPANVNTVSMFVGRKDGNPFGSFTEANAFKVRENLGEGFTVKQRGTGFVLETTAPTRETSDGTRVFMELGKDAANDTPMSKAPAFINFLRNSKNLVSDLHGANKDVATGPAQETLRLMKEMAEPIGKLSRGSARALRRQLELNRDLPNPHAPNERGYFYQTQGELDREFHRVEGRYPTAQESTAYWTAVQINDLDYVARDLGLLRDLSRQGVENFRYGEGQQRSPWFQGRRETDLPWDDTEPATILYIDRNGQRKIVNMHDVKDTDLGNEIKTAINEQGFRVTQVADPVGRPLKDAAQYDHMINFVVAKDTERKALTPGILKYHPGGHSIYPNNWWVKAPIVARDQYGRLVYYGDQTLLNFKSEAEARKYAGLMDQARLMTKNSDPGLDSFLARNLPWNRQEWDLMFHRGVMNVDSPVLPSFSGRTVLDTNPSLRNSLTQGQGRFIDGTSSKYNLYSQIDRSMTADRDQIALTVKERMNPQGDTIAEIGKAKQLDPLSALQRGSADIMRNRYMNDYKHYAVETYIAQFKDVLSADPELMKSNPIKYLYGDYIKKSVPPNLLEMQRAAQAFRRSTIEFLGQQTEFGADISALENRLLNSIYERWGQKAVDKVPDNALNLIRDPATYFRSMAFHMKLGMFNPVQFVVQAQQMANIWAISGPVTGSKAWPAGVVTFFLNHTDKASHVQFADKIMREFGWKAGDFEKSMSLLERSGFANVGNETAYRSDVFDPKLWKSAGATWLDKGALFFNSGERLARNMAWHASVLEYQKANHVVDLMKLNNRQLGQILNRADELAGNMTRASNAAWQSGIWSVPSQFLAYNAKLAEMLLSNQLTAGERQRLLATFSLLYGVPAAGSAVGGVYPLHEDLRKYAIDRGINMDNWITAAFTNGLPQLLIKAVTGSEPNLQRLSPGGGSLLKDIIRGEKGFAEIAFGASGKTMMDIIKTASPLLGSILPGFNPEVPLSHNTWVDVARNLSSVDLGVKTYMAYMYGKYVTKKDVPVTEVNGMDTFFIAMGFSPQAAADAFAKRELWKDQKQAQNEAISQARRAFQAGLKHLASGGDTATWEKYREQATGYIRLGNFLPSQYATVFRQVFNNADLADTAERNYIKNAPADRLGDRLQTLGR